MPIGSLLEEWAVAQLEGSKSVSEEDECSPESIRIVAGVDIHWTSPHEGVCVAAVVNLAASTSEPARYFRCSHATPHAYVSGFLGFRECDAFAHVLREATAECAIDCVLVDGNGRLHPRAFGSACQLGLSINLRTIGVAKSLDRVCGVTEREVKERMNADALLELDLQDTRGRTIGRAIRKTAQNQAPAYISIGHRISLNTAASLVRRLLHYSVPEPLRLADIHARNLSRGLL